MTTNDDAAQELLSLRLAHDMSGGATIVVDTDLVVVSAEGPDLVGAGYDPADLAGRRLDDLLVSAKVLAAYRCALGGEQARVELVHEGSGRFFDVEVRPLHGRDGAVLGAVARARDLSVSRAQQTHLDHVGAMHGLGVSTYDLRSGWAHDARTLTMLALDDHSAAGLHPGRLVDAVVLAPDRSRVRATWSAVLATGGRVVASYRVRAGSSDPGDPGEHAVRWIQSTVEVDLGTGGQLLRVVATHLDVTASSSASAAVDRAEQQLQADRLGLVRDLSAVVSRSPLTVHDIVKVVTDLAVAALGGGAFFAELSSDGTHFSRVATSHADPGAAGALHALWANPLGQPRPDDEVLGSVLANGRSWVGVDSSRGPGRLGDEGDHLVVVPVQVHARVAGVLGLQRPGPDLAYRPGDVDLALIMADHVGAALVAEQAHSGEQRERARREAATLLLDDARSQRHSLVELLSETETRERMLLAEAVHDEPIQLIAAARLRLMALVRRLAKQDPEDVAALHEMVGVETERVGGILETAMERLRVLIVALTPPDLSDGLLHAIGEVAEATFRGTGTTVRCIGPVALSLTPAQADAAMRILREALINVRQHAQARRVVVRATIEDGEVVLTIEDDGVGSTDIGPRKGHLGMVSMRARAADAGALLTVSSTPGAGTSVALHFPPVV